MGREPQFHVSALKQHAVRQWCEIISALGIAPCSFAGGTVDALDLDSKRPPQRQLSDFGGMKMGKVRL